jgi:hypothetical protein
MDLPGICSTAKEALNSDQMALKKLANYPNGFGRKFLPEPSLRLAHEMLLFPSEELSTFPRQVHSPKQTNGRDGGLNKSGTMDGIRTLAVYADTSAHGRVRFVISLASNDETRFQFLQAIKAGL